MSLINIGYDASGNGNNWTANNLDYNTTSTGTDVMVDVPTNWGTDTGVGGEVRGNYATWNPLDQLDGSLSNGNLDSTTGTSGGSNCRGTFAMSSGKWYFEVTPISNGGIASIGVSIFPGSDAKQGSIYVYQADDGNKYSPSGGSQSFGSTYTTNDVISVAVDMDAGYIWWAKNGTWQASGSPSTGSNPALTGLSGNAFAYLTDRNVGGVCTVTLNAGQRPFAYTAPSGFAALCTQNLSEPTIVDGSQYMTAYLYTADGTSPKSRTGIGFAPDFLWFKDRTTAFSHALYDILRGTNKGLQSNSTAAENSYTLMTAFGSDGFTTSDDGTVGNLLNYSTDAYVTWAWKANGTGVTNTAGSITSTVSANTTAGFSIITYTGNGTSGATVGHGLGAAPSMVIVKERNNANAWCVFHSSVGATKFLRLNGTDAETTQTDIWNDTAPTSTVFSVGNANATNRSANGLVAYCFAPIAGFSAFGSFQGNGSSDGPFVFCNFRPRYVLIKNASTTSDWFVYDTSRNTYNVADSRLKPNLSDAEGTGGSYGPDILSNGFKMRSNFGELNGSGNTIIYAAFAENPFKYALAR